jgi:hypothetical protein
LILRFFAENIRCGEVGVFAGGFAISTVFLVVKTW